jgi:hypothetical protein
MMVSGQKAMSKTVVNDSQRMPGRTRARRTQKCQVMMAAPVR